MTLLLPPIASGAPLRNVIHHADFFELVSALPSASVDMFLCDLPYGTTACSWDTIIPFAPMWTAIKRVMRPRGAVVLTASQPFTSALVMSNPGMFRYEWVWEKTAASGFLDANRKPLKRHESILVFSIERAPYYPIFAIGEPYKTIRSGATPLYGNHERTWTISDGRRYPTSIIEFSNPNGNNKIHPTQKPVALFEYLIRTYTRPGELVVDPCVGSGTTAVAARNTGRDYICGDKELKYVEIARERLSAPYTPPLFDTPALTVKAEQLSLMEVD